MHHRYVSCLMVLLAVVCLTTAPALAVTSNYAFDINTNGNPVTDVFIYAQSGGQHNLYASPQVIAPTGIQSLSLDTDFVPETVLILGVLQDDAQGPHVIMFTDVGFAYNSIGLRYNQAFNSAATGYLGHNLLINTIRAAHSGNASSLNQLLTFVQGPGSVAAFDYGSPFAIVEFSIVDVPIGHAIPEPATAALGLMSLGGLMLSALRRRRTA